MEEDVQCCAVEHRVLHFGHTSHFLMQLKMRRLSGGFVLHKVRHEIRIPLLFKNCSHNRTCKEEKLLQTFRTSQTSMHV